MRPARSQRRGKDDGRPHLRHAAAARRGRRARGRARRRLASPRGPVPDRAHRPERRGRRHPHRAPEPRDVRAPVPPLAAGRAAARGRAAGALRARRCGAQAGQDLLGRDAAAARPRGQLHPRAARALPRRADHGPGPAQPQRGVGRDPLVRDRGNDGAAHDALPGRGGPARGPDLGDRSRARDRGRDAGGAEGAGRRVAGRRGGERWRRCRWPRWRSSGCADR